MNSLFLDVFFVKQALQGTELLDLLLSGGRRSRTERAIVQQGQYVQQAFSFFFFWIVHGRLELRGFISIQICQQIQHNS
jgi:hypothetical protein